MSIVDVGHMMFNMIAPRMLIRILAVSVMLVVVISVVLVLGASRTRYMIFLPSMMVSWRGVVFLQMPRHSFYKTFVKRRSALLAAQVIQLNAKQAVLLLQTGEPLRKRYNRASIA